MRTSTTHAPALLLAALTALAALGCRDTAAKAGPSDSTGDSGASADHPTRDAAMPSPGAMSPNVGPPKTETSTTPDAGGQRGLAESAPSPEALAQRILDGLRHRDRAALESTLVSEDEYRTLLWPAFLTKMPRTTVTADLSFRLLRASTEKALLGALNDQGGQDLELLAVGASQGLDEYEGLTLHKRVVLTVRRRTDGREGELQILGSFVERDGEWKLLSFKD